jgi:hypothetical protein
LIDRPRREALQVRYREIHEQLRRGGAGRAAQILLELLPPPDPGAQVSFAR